MARGLAAYSAAIPGADELGPADIDSSVPAGTIVIDGHTGQVTREGPNGSLIFGMPGTAARQRRNGARDFDENLADDPEVPLSSICERLLEGIDADIQSRRDWEETANNGRDLLGVILEKPSSQATPEGTVSKIKDLAYIEAIIRSWANSRAELLPANGPVKVTDDQSDLETQAEAVGIGHNGGPALDAGPEAEAAGGEGSSPQAGPAAAQPPPGPKKPTRSQLADALEKDMNHYLTVVDKEYVPDFSRMLLNRAINGVQFRKVYRCPLKRRPVSIWVRGEDLIVSNDCSHLSGAGRVTERIRVRPAVAKRMMHAGAWRKVSLAMPVANASATDENIAQQEGVKSTPQLPEDVPHTIYECYCELDDGPLARDEKGHEIGFPLPYRVTIEKDSRTVLEIRRNWKQSDEDFTARRRYVKYGFVPGLGFYDWGFVHILGNSQRGATAIDRQIIDSGSFASFPGWVMAKGPGTRQKNSIIRPNPGEAIVIETGGLKIGDVVMALPYKEPSPALQAMGTTISTNMRRVAGVLEVPVGEGRVGNVPVGTMMSYVDAISKVPSAVHKDDHAAQSEEFELLRELLAEEPEVLTRGVKRPARTQPWTEEELNDHELVPKADPNVPSQVHRLMQTTALAEASAMPQFQGIADQRAIWREICLALGRESPDEVTMPPQPAQPPPPPPQVIAAQIRAASQDKATEAKTAQAKTDDDTKSLQSAAEMQDKAEDRASEERRAGMKLAGEVAKAHAGHESDVADRVQDHAQHLNELAQGDRHKAADVATAQQAAMVPPNGEPEPQA